MELHPRTRVAEIGIYSCAGPYFFALDALTGEELWNRNLGGRVHAGPMGFAVDGRQHVAIAAGNAVFAFALP